jgi:hypothetical protein
LAATIHYVTRDLWEAKRSEPTEDEVVAAVLDWKQKRRPPFDRSDVAEAVRSLNVLRWIQAKPSDGLRADPEFELLHD